jgi:hypothetical protein
MGEFLIGQGILFRHFYLERVVEEVVGGKKTYEIL